MRKLDGIEASRGVAALAVVFFHTSVMVAQNYGGRPALGGLFEFGHGGVDFFFVLSGFIVWHAHGKLVDQPQMLPLFLWRRFARIFPPYWSSLALLIMTYAVFAGLGLPMTDWWKENGGPRLLGNLLVWPIEPPFMLDVAWTLTYELAFYLAFSVAIWRGRLGLWLFAVWQAAVVVANLVGQAPPEAFLLRLQHLEFGFGILAAVVLARGKVAAPGALLAGGCLVFAAAGLAADAGLVGHGARPLKLLFGLCSAVIVVGLVEAERRGRLAAPGWLSRLGAASYSIFLAHLIFLEPFLTVVVRGGWLHVLTENGVFLIGSAGGVAIGIAFHRWVERPLTRLPTPQFPHGR
jgi:exopolysaccharide production protein ExoZ